MTMTHESIQEDRQPVGHARLASVRRPGNLFVSSMPEGKIMTTLSETPQVTIHQKSFEYCKGYNDEARLCSFQGKSLVFSGKVSKESVTESVHFTYLPFSTSRLVLRV